MKAESIIQSARKSEDILNILENFKWTPVMNTWKSIKEETTIKRERRKGT